MLQQLQNCYIPCATCWTSPCSYTRSQVVSLITTYLLYISTTQQVPVMMKAISLLLVLLLHQEAANAVPVTRSVVHSVSRRSAEYDDYLARQERDATNQCTWKTSRWRCWFQFESYTKYDELGRRESKYLADALDQGRCGSCLCWYIYWPPQFGCSQKATKYISPTYDHLWNKERLHRKWQRLLRRFIQLCWPYF